MLKTARFLSIEDNESSMENWEEKNWKYQLNMESIIDDYRTLCLVFIFLFLNTIRLQATSRKPMRCIGKLLKIKFKLILIPLTFFVEFFFLFFFSSKCYRQDQ